MQDPTYEKDLTEFNLAGFPYFFGMALFVLEGNAVSIDIYHQSTKPTFNSSIFGALVIVSCLVNALAFICYAAYG